MSIYVGPANQNGYIVPDLDAAMTGWLGFGVGPWIVYRHVKVVDFMHRGVAQSPVFSVGLANTGSVQIELIEPHDDTPSMHREFLDAYPAGGLQHLGYWSSDYDALLEDCLDRGWEVGQAGTFGGVRFTYFDTDVHPGTVVEIADVDEAHRAAFARIEQMAAEWDGHTRPIREIDLS